MWRRCKFELRPKQFTRCGQALLGVAIVVAWVGTAAAEGWPDFPTTTPHQITRGPGMYFSWWKIGLLWALFLLWVRVTDWVSQDTQTHKLPHAVWNPVVFFPFIIGLFAFGLTIPIFAVGCGMTFLTFAIPTLVYVIQRNQKLEPHERVMTPAHIRHLVSQALGGAMSSEKKKRHEKGARVTFEAAGKNEQLSQANLIKARQDRAFLPTKALFANAVDHRADKILLDFTAEGTDTKYQVDGVWHAAELRDRGEGDEVLKILKTLADLDPEERRKRQESYFKSQYKTHKLNCHLLSQGTKTGERVILTFTEASIPFDSLADLGMREKMVARLKELMLKERGMIVFCSMPSGGLTTTLTVALNSTDRLLRDFIVLLAEKEQLQEIENVDPVTYSAEKGESPDEVLPTLARKQPDVLVMPTLASATSTELLCNMAAEEQLVFTTIRAKEAVEALLRVLLIKDKGSKKGVSAKTFAPVVVGVLNQRLVRKLCDTCKEEFEPSAELLKKLGLPAGRVERLYRHPENPDDECPNCHGVGYLGRTSVFELLVVDDKLREVLIKQPKMDILRKVARAGGHRSLQEEGIALVIKGVTSLPELMRVLKQ